MTRAMCPPGSLYDRFISDLGYVRSFVLKDGHLFLATRTDGAILEFEPM
jgi:para-nitrobenzyl esterase